MLRHTGVLKGLRAGFWSAFASSQTRHDPLRRAARPVVEALERRVLFALATPVVTATAYAGEVDLNWQPVAVTDPNSYTYIAVLRPSVTPDAATAGHFIVGNYVTVGYTTVGLQANEFLDMNGYQGFPPDFPIPYEVIASNDDAESSNPAILTVTTAAPSATPTGNRNVSAYTGQTISLFATTNELDNPTFHVNFGDGTSTQPTPAPVNWGGLTNEGVVIPGSGYGSASHAYSAPGAYDAKFSFADGAGVTVSGAGFTATTDFNITVTNAPLAITANPIHAVAGQTFSGIVATVATPDTSLGASDFSGTINWGNGSTSAATFQATSTGGVFDVIGSHLYSATGSQSISVTVTGGGTTATGSSDAAITRATPTGLAIVGTPGGSIATIGWNAVSGASAYQIFRGISPTTLSLLDTAVASTSYQDTDLGANLEPGKTYYYSVKAIDSASTSLPSATLAVTTACSGPAACPAVLFGSCSALEVGCMVLVVYTARRESAPNSVSQAILRIRRAPAPRPGSLTTE
jgi:hypothetical protein